MTSQNTATKPDASRATPTFGVIIIGDEILSGKRADKHLPKVIELLEQVKIPHAADVAARYPHQISGGMAQRVQLAASMVHHSGWLPLK